MTVCLREKRRADEPETTTADWTNALKDGFQNTFNEENLNKGINLLSDLFGKAKVKL